MVRWTEEEFDRFQKRRAPAPQRTSKYRNQKTEADGIIFDSKKEAGRWLELKLEERTGRIANLRRQVSYGITVNGEHVCNYRADFVYERDGRRIVEDCKGMRTEVYTLKRKLMAAVHGIEITET